MYTFLLVLLIVDAFVLALVILLQAGKGGGVAAAFGGATSSAEAFIGMRQAGNWLTKASWWAGGIFLGLAFVLQLMSARTRVPTSVLDRPLPAAPGTQPQRTAPAPAVPLQPQGSQPVPSQAPPPATPPTGGQSPPNR